jgi:hypothetical protein
MVPRDGNRTADAGLFSGVIGNQGVTYLTWQSVVNRSVTHRGTVSTDISASVRRFTLVQKDEKPASRRIESGPVSAKPHGRIADFSSKCKLPDCRQPIRNSEERSDRRVSVWLTLLSAAKVQFSSSAAHSGSSLMFLGSTRGCAFIR